jgi:hypothetical protein
MNPDNFPPYIKQLFQNRDLTMNQKMVTLMAFMPEIPYSTETAQIWEDGEKVGREIKELIGKGKIRLDGFDKDFKIKVSHC